MDQRGGGRPTGVDQPLNRADRTARSAVMKWSSRASSTSSIMKPRRRCASRAAPPLPTATGSLRDRIAVTAQPVTAAFRALITRS